MCGIQNADILRLLQASAVTALLGTVNAGIINIVALNDQAETR